MKDDDILKCHVCPRNCMIPPNFKGFCNARKNDGEKIICDNYGKITALALDPIEKKPLGRFMPGSKILSVGSYGCNLRCGFCQNSGISMCDDQNINTLEITPEEIRDRALESIDMGNIGVAYTYNEPLIGYEFVRDCSVLVHDAGLKNVIVSNGYICKDILYELSSLIDAANIDLKAFNERFYRNIGGHLETVKRTIEIMAGFCHIELTALIIPDENDSEEEMHSMCRWIAGIDKNIPLHISRFFPAFEYSDREATSRKLIERLYDIALLYLNFVYKGNC